MRKVNKDLAIPLHMQLSQIIREMIETNQLPEGSQLMPEREICKLQDISRMTVNKAILTLVNEGLLRRKQGSGTVVASKKKKHRYEKLEGFTDIMNKKGYKIRNELILFELSPQSEQIRQRLQLIDLDTDPLVYQIKRVRYIEDDAFVIETVYLNQLMCPDLSEELVKEKSLYQLYRERYQHKIIRAEQSIKPVMITKEQAKLLNAAPNTLALQIDRTVYTDKEEVMEYTSSIFMTNHHEFEVVLHEN